MRVGLSEEEGAPVEGGQGGQVGTKAVVDLAAPVAATRAAVKGAVVAVVTMAVASGVTAVVVV